MAAPKYFSKLPKITDYPWQRRQDYLLLVAAVASADNELHPDELELLTGWVEDFKLSERARQQVYNIAHQGPLPARDKIIHRMAKTDLVWSLQIDLMAMAMVDGVLMDPEIGMLRDIAYSLNIDPIDFNILIEFIHSAHQASKLDNPEPLYEHNIDSAFQLLKEKKVRLFPHTLLCVSSAEFNLHLKERWAKFNTKRRSA